MEGQKSQERRLSFPSLVDAARQQTELVCWVAKSLQEHEGRIDALSGQLSQLLHAAGRASRRNSGVASRAASAAAASLVSPGIEGPLSRPATQLADAEEASERGPPPSLVVAESELAASSPGTYLDLPASASAQSMREGSLRESSLLEGSARESVRELDGLEGDVNEGQDESEAQDAFEAQEAIQDPPASPLLEQPPRTSVISSSGLELVGRRLSSAEGEVQISSRSPRTSSVARRRSSEIGDVELSVAPTASSRRNTLHQQAAESATGGVEEPMSNFVKFDDRLNAIEDFVNRSLGEVQQRTDPLVELLRRLEALEEAVGSQDPTKEIKELRLQIAGVSVDLQALQESVQQLGESVEKLEDRPEHPQTPHEVVQGSLQREGSVMSAEGGPSVSPGASRRTSANSTWKPSGLGSMAGRASQSRPSALQAVRSSSPHGPASALLDELSGRVERLEAQGGGVQEDAIERLTRLEDGLQELDGSYKGTAKVLKERLEMLALAEQRRAEEDTDRSKTWNLANQVDVIQSLVAQELVYAKAEFRSLMKEELQHVDPSWLPSIGPPLPRVSRTGRVGAGTEGVEVEREARRDYGKDIKDMEEKIKRLQDCYQQCTLKLAGLKASYHHAEQRASLAADRTKKLAEDVEQLMEQGARSEARLDQLFAGRSSVEGDGTAPLVTPSSRRGRLRVGSDRILAGGTPAASERGPSDVSNEDSGDSTTLRILRLGKKVSNMDGELNQDLKLLREELELTSQRLGMLSSFLPRRQRRLVERIMAVGHNKEEEGEEGGKANDTGETGARRVQFSDKPETRTYDIMEEDSQLPWQAVGEVDQKWYWCHKNLNELGRPLAAHLEQLEHERDYFEQEMAANLERLEGQLSTMVHRRPTKQRGSMQEEEVGPVLTGGVEKLTRTVEKILMPRLASTDDRMERLANDMRESKKSQEKDRSEKASKEELQLLAMRLAVFDSFDPKDLESKLAELGTSGKTLAERHDLLTAEMKRIQAASATRTELEKVNVERASLKMEFSRIQTSLNELSAQFFAGNRTLSQTVSEAKSNFERGIAKMEKEKATMWEYANLMEKVSKLEGSMRDNRQILSGAGSQEVGTFVKRIILNMEDKIMVLEKKVDCLAEGRAIDVSALPALESLDEASTERVAPKVQVQALEGEIVAMNQAVSQLKQEIHISKVDMDHILEQGQLHADLAQRLNVYVERASEEGPAGQGAASLTLSRVQVMVAAAARQLVAGSKWVTKETFDARFADLRKELLQTSRQLQTQLEDMGGQVSRSVPSNGGALPGPKLPKMLMKRPPPDGSSDVPEWPPMLSGEKLSPEKQQGAGHFQSLGRPPGSAPAAGAAGGAGRRPAPRRPLTERSQVRERPEA